MNMSSILETVKGLKLFAMVYQSKLCRYIRLLSWNANNVQGKKYELQELLQRERIDVCATNETHLLPNVALIATLSRTARTELYAAGAWLSW
jgi:hypothetical protein